MKKLMTLAARLFVFLLIAGFTFLGFIMIIASIDVSRLGGFLATVITLSAFIVPVVTGIVVTAKIFKSEKDLYTEKAQDADADIAEILAKEGSTLSVIKEELSCWNWQLVVGGTILVAGFLRLFSSFLFSILLIVFGLGIMSVGAAKYKEKQEMQERELRRKIMAAAAKDFPAHANAKEERKPCAITKSRTYKVAGVSYYVQNIEKLCIENEDYSKSKRELIADGLTDERIWKYEFYEDSAELQPEPDNPEDPRAIKVIVDGEHVGYIKKGSCAHLHKLIQNQAIARIDCTVGGGPYKYVSEEYDVEKDKEVYVLENNETNYFVNLEIYEKTDEF